MLLKLIDWLRRLRDAELGHDDLRLDSFLVYNGNLLLADAVQLTQGGLSRKQLATFAHNAHSWLSQADRVRVWRALVGDENLPAVDRAALFRRDRRTLDITPFDGGEWKGEFLNRGARPTPWSIAASHRIMLADWQREWPRLLALLRADQLDILKRDQSGDILGGSLPLAGVPVDIVLKRPLNKFFYRSLLGILRRSRGRRLWEKSLLLYSRGLPVEQPLLLMERRVLGRAVESLAVFERVPGPTLAMADLDAMRLDVRDTFFRRCGRVLRDIEAAGLTHTDAKSTNWIVFDDAAAGPTPVLIDAYGIRKLTSFLQLFGIKRLLRAMKQHAQYTPADSLAICLGFSPKTKPGQDPLPEALDAN